MKKNYKKAIIVFSAMISVSCATTVNESTTIPNVLYTTNKPSSDNSWSSSTTVTSGTRVSFELHYYVSKGNYANNMRFFLENLDGQTFNAGTSKNVSGTIAADGVTDRTGSVSVKFIEKVKLHLDNVSWQKVPCKSISCETSLPQDYRNIINGSGLNIGDVNGNNRLNYAGNIIVTFKAEKVQ